MKFPTLDHELRLWNSGYTVIGIDEVGRGAFAGPVYVSGVIFEPTTDLNRISKLLAFGINDSKKLTAKKREKLSNVIENECFAFKISSKEVPYINKVGIGKAAFSAMRDAIGHLVLAHQISKPFVLVDGFNIKHLKGIGIKNQKAIIGGDGISLSIAAASIVAKVARDKHMTKLSADFKSYGWGKNKGYGTASHRAAISNFGACNHHRSAFVKNFIPDRLD